MRWDSWGWAHHLHLITWGFACGRGSPGTPGGPRRASARLLVEHPSPRGTPGPFARPPSLPKHGYHLRQVWVSDRPPGRAQRALPPGAGPGLARGTTAATLPQRPGGPVAAPPPRPPPRSPPLRGQRLRRPPARCRCCPGRGPRRRRRRPRGRARWGRRGRQDAAGGGAVAAAASRRLWGAAPEEGGEEGGREDAALLRLPGGRPGRLRREVQGAGPGAGGRGKLRRRVPGGGPLITAGEWGAGEKRELGSLLQKKPTNKPRRTTQKTEGHAAVAKYWIPRDAGT